MELDCGTGWMQWERGLNGGGVVVLVWWYDLNGISKEDGHVWRAASSMFGRPLAHGRHPHGV